MLTVGPHPIIQSITAPSLPAICTLKSLYTDGLIFVRDSLVLGAQEAHKFNVKLRYKIEVINQGAQCYNGSLSKAAGGRHPC